MNNQEMQFADPEWRPSQQGNRNTDLREQEPYIPQPINTDPREQPEWQATPPQQEGAYTGSVPYADFRAEKIGGNQLRQRPRVRRSPWFWIILAVLAFAILGRLASPSFGFDGHTVHDLNPRSFSAGTHPMIVINDNIGTIDIHAGNGNTVTIKPTEEHSGFGSNPDTTVNYNQSSDGTITVNVENNGFSFFGSRSVNLDVTVPSNTNLQVKTDTGEIDVTGVNGQMSLTSETGSINATQDSLSGQSILKTDTGSVIFNGSIDPNGTYQFEANTGSVDVTLPSNSSFHVDATTDTGSINSNFPGVNVQRSDVTGASAHNDVGNPPRATLTLKTDTGSISLNTQ